MVNERLMWQPLPQWRGVHPHSIVRILRKWRQFEFSENARRTANRILKDCG